MRLALDLGLGLGPRRNRAVTTVNLLAKSEAFNDVAWSKSTVNVSADAGASPTGTTTADKLIVQAAATDGFCIQSKPAAIGTYTLSVYFKQVEFTSAALTMFSSEDGTTNTVFNIGAGSITSGSGVITPAANGFYRCSITKTFTGLTSAQCQVIVKGLGDGTKSVLAWGAQLETGSSVTGYVAT